MNSRVDVIVACHSPDRPLGRAVNSILGGNPEARPVVVSHNIDAETLRQHHPELNSPRVQVLELHDGIPSPSGPFNYGIAQSSAEFVSIMGSDDCLDAGAVAHWLDFADRWQADAVITRLVRGDQRVLVRSPAIRPLHTGLRDVVRDRLSYRSAPLGLVRRRAVDELNLVLTPGARNGGDLAFVTRLWSLGRIVYAAGGPGYVEMSGAADRVTGVMKSVDEELQPVVELVGSDWFVALPSRTRRAVAVKLLRRNIMDSIVKRRRESWEPPELRRLAEIVTLVFDSAPHLSRLLSCRERRLFQAVSGAPGNQLTRAADAAKEYRHPAALVGLHPESWVHPAGPLRYAFAGALMR